MSTGVPTLETSVSGRSRDLLSAALFSSTIAVLLAVICLIARIGFAYSPVSIGRALGLSLLFVNLPLTISRRSSLTRAESWATGMPIMTAALCVLVGLL